MQFAPYNRKGFLCPDSIHSMASYHAKIYENGEYRFRIHDCLTSIRLIGKLETEQDFAEAVQKTGNLAKALYEFSYHVEKLKYELFHKTQTAPEQSDLPYCDADHYCDKQAKFRRCTKGPGTCNQQIQQQ